MSLAKFAANQVLNTGQTLDEAFPAVDPGITPFGSRVIVQIRRPMSVTKGGIRLITDTKDTEKWNTQVGKVCAIGALAFRSRSTKEQWPEGSWCELGEFVRVPKYGGDRWEIPFGPGEDDIALFAMFNDLDLLGKVTVDPRTIRAFL